MDRGSASETRGALGGAPVPGSSVRYSVAVVGAGAAGLLAAIFAARSGASVILLETRPVPGAKIRTSGGGRCNILPSRFDLSRFHTGSSRNSLRNILLSWPLDSVRAFFETELALPLKVEPSGKVFPASDSSRQVVDALLRETSRVGVRLVGSSRVEGLSRGQGEAGAPPTFRIEGAAGEPVLASSVVLATGGLSLPRTGSDGGGLAMARALGHSMRDPHPALVPLRSAEAGWKDLSGISLPARVRVHRGARLVEERDGDFLFTHRGFSGPVVLDVSRNFTGPGGREMALTVAWGGAEAPDWEVLLLEPGRRPVARLVRDHLPHRLADRLLALAGIPAGRVTSGLPREERDRILRLLLACPLAIAGDEGYGVAEVTAGGIPLEEVSSKTLESRVVPRLFLAGEILDVDGHIGGHNFLWAWVSGRMAGLAAGGTPVR